MLSLQRVTAVAVAAALLLPVMPAAHAGESGKAVTSKPAHRREIVRPPIYNAVPPSPPIYNSVPSPIERDPYDPFVEPWNNPNFHGYNGG